MKSVNAHWISETFQPVPLLERFDEQRPRVLQVRNHHHRDDGHAELKPAVVDLQRGLPSGHTIQLPFLAGKQLKVIQSGTLRRELEEQISGEVRFDAVSRALYSTDASVYQIDPLGVVIAKSREDILRTVNLARAHGVSITARGGGTSQAGQAIGGGLQLDTSKYYNRILELNVPERWAIVEPGIVLDELNAQLKQHGLRFAPDISTASRATIGGMISNNSAAPDR